MFMRGRFGPNIRTCRCPVQDSLYFGRLSSLEILRLPQGGLGEDAGSTDNGMTRFGRGCHPVMFAARRLVVTDRLVVTEPFLRRWRRAWPPRASAGVRMGGISRDQVRGASPSWAEVG
jgi:hypothetical protein